MKVQGKGLAEADDDGLFARQTVLVTVAVVVDNQQGIDGQSADEAQQDDRSIQSESEEVIGAAGGHETEEDVRRLRQLTGRPLIQAFRVETADDLRAAERSTADEILLDSGAGTGTAFDWALLRDAARPYFLAGGLSPENVAGAVTLLRPYAVDVSSGIETGGVKDRMKMAAFVAAVRKAGGI